MMALQARPGFVRAGDSAAGEPGSQQQVTVLRLGEGAAKAADPLLGFGELAGIDALVRRDVADAQAAAGPQHPENFSKDAWLVGGQVDDTIGDHHIDTLIRQRDVLDMAVQEAGIGDPGLRWRWRGRE